MKPIILDDGTVIPGDEDCKWLDKQIAKKLKTMEEIRRKAMRDNGIDEIIPKTPHTVGEVRSR